MTDEEIDGMEAGSELDALILEHVFGGSGHFAYYSTRIESAWLVVEKMLASQHWSDFGLEYDAGEWRAADYYLYGCDGGWENRSYAKTAPLAICRHALKCCKAVGKEAS